MLPFGYDDDYDPDADEDLDNSSDWDEDDWFTIINDTTEKESYLECWWEGEE